MCAEVMSEIGVCEERRGFHCTNQSIKREKLRRASARGQGPRVTAPHASQARALSCLGHFAYVLHVHYPFRVYTRIPSMESEKSTSITHRLSMGLRLCE